MVICHAWSKPLPSWRFGLNRLFPGLPTVETYHSSCAIGIMQPAPLTPRSGHVRLGHIAVVCRACRKQVRARCLLQPADRRDCLHRSSSQMTSVWRALESYHSVVQIVSVPKPPPFAPKSRGAQQPSPRWRVVRIRTVVRPMRSCSWRNRDCCIVAVFRLR